MGKESESVVEKMVNFDEVQDPNLSEGVIRSGSFDGQSPISKGQKEINSQFERETREQEPDDDYEDSSEASGDDEDE